MESTCRAFRGIFHYFWVVCVDMHHLMRIYAFLRGNLHACDVRERRSAKLDDVAAQPPSDFDAFQRGFGASIRLDVCSRYCWHAYLENAQALLSPWLGSTLR